MTTGPAMSFRNGERPENPGEIRKNTQPGAKPRLAKDADWRYDFAVSLHL